MDEVNLMLNNLFYVIWKLSLLLSARVLLYDNSLATLGIHLVKIVKYYKSDIKQL